MTRGLYIHIPFCKSKCNYCDFYSGNFPEDTQKKYVDKLCEEIEKWGRLNTCPIDTIYFGGGTPSRLSAAQLEQIFAAIRRSFIIDDNTEITLEVNPGDSLSFIETAAKLSVNRISVGVQSANDNELKMLGRRHSFDDAIRTIDYIKNVGIANISADLMIGLPNSSLASLEKSITEFLSLEIPHISSYILKIEDNTPFYKSRITLPDDDVVAEQYLYMSQRFESCGYEHYEISNFAKPNMQSKHNNKYWLCEEYIGVGPSAHSFFDGKRMYYPRSIEAFLKNPAIIDDGLGGDKFEYTMLALRLARGLVFEEYNSRYGNLPKAFFDTAKKLSNYINITNNSISLNNNGMLLSNTIINLLLEVL